MLVLGKSNASGLVGTGLLVSSALVLGKSNASGLVFASGLLVLGKSNASGRLFGAGTGLAVSILTGTSLALLGSSLSGSTNLIGSSFLVVIISNSGVSPSLGCSGGVVSTLGGSSLI